MYKHSKWHIIISCLFFSMVTCIKNPPTNPTGHGKVLGEKKRAEAPMLLPITIPLGSTSNFCWDTQKKRSSGSKELKQLGKRCKKISEDLRSVILFLSFSVLKNGCQLLVGSKSHLDCQATNADWRGEGGLSDKWNASCVDGIMENHRITSIQMVYFQFSRFDDQRLFISNFPYT